MARRQIQLDWKMKSQAPGSSLKLSSHTLSSETPSPIASGWLRRHSPAATTLSCSLSSLANNIHTRVAHYVCTIMNEQHSLLCLITIAGVFHPQVNG